MVDRDYLPAPASVDEPEIDLGDLLARIWRGKLWVLAAVLACSAIAAVHVFLAARVYRSETVLVLREDEQSGGAVSMLRGSSLGGLASLAGLGTSAAGGRRGEFVAVLKSRRLVREFVVSRELTPLLYASRWDSASNQVRPGLFGGVPTIGDSVDLFASRLSISEDVKTGLLTASFEWSDPELAAVWVNDYVALANELLRQEAIKSSEESMTYLNEELARTSVEPVRQALFRLMEVRINQAMLANVEREYAFRPVDRAEPSETKKFVSPQPLVELLTAIMCGVALGAIFACWRYRKSALDPKADA